MSAAAPAPLPGWDTSVVRFEPIDAPVGVAGLGSYRGSIEVQRTATGLAVVNEVGFEDYLLGISEVPVSWPVEAQRAQAIAARTYAAHEVLTPRPASAVTGAHLCATDACQVYVGLAKERREGAQRWADAVHSTAGQVLLHRGAPILAKYSSTNGGRTVAGGRPYLRSQPDPDDAVSPYHRWQSLIPFHEIARVLALPGPVTSVTRIGDVVELRWELPEALGTATLPAAEFRLRMNEALPAPVGLPLPIPSIWFELGVDPATSNVVVDGRGWGHGIGMSQFGALGKALRGARAESILAAYYGGIRPERSAQLPDQIRVLLGDSLAGVELAAEGHFRVVDGNGTLVAVAGAGGWKVVPGRKGGLRVVPPADQAGAPRLTDVEADPAAPSAGEPVDMRFRLSAPAVVRVSVQSGDGSPAKVTRARVLDAGEVVQPLHLPESGHYVVTVHADAGGGRQAAAPVGVRVRPPGATSQRRSEPPFLATSGWGRRAPTALATLLMTVLLSAAWAGRSEVVSVARVEFEALRGRRGA